MRIMADTNVLISALFFPDSSLAKVLLHIASAHDLILCDRIVVEFRDVVSRKRPDLLADIDVLLAQLSYELVIAPQEPGKLIENPKDQPILNAAILADVDVIVSGDKHFLRLDLEHPRTLSPAQFWQLEHASVA